MTTASGSAPVVLAEDAMQAVAGSRTILSAQSHPPRDALVRLAGARAGSHLRAALETLLPDEKRAGTPLYLLLDDMAGATLVSAWAFSRWDTRWMDQAANADRAQRILNMEGVCIGFRSGSGALGSQGRPHSSQNFTRVVSLVNPDDPAGWHDMVTIGEVNFRRARRIDVWQEDGVLQIDSAFQDSASSPQGGRVAIHEYRVTATADAATQQLLSIDAIPGTLPYAECRAAPVNLPSLLGTPLSAMRDTVLLKLRKTAGCTHLNDMTRALAEVPILARHLLA